MSINTQDHRLAKVKSLLPENRLLFRKMTGVERLGELFDYQVQLLSVDTDIDLNELLGTDMSIAIERPDEGVRFFNGYVAEAAQIGFDGELAKYGLTLKPWLWFLTRTADCRIFQEKSVPDILSDLFHDEGFTDFDLQLTGEYQPRNYCVQYAESDFDFVSRLMEQEGIYYYFRHEDGKHTMVICDNVVAHDAVKGYEKVPMFYGEPNPLPDVEHFTSIHLVRKVQSGGVATKDFNFVQPGDNMLASSRGAAEHARADYEIYDYSGEYPSASNGVKVRDFGERISRFRLEALQASHETTIVEGQVTGLGAGNLFALAGAEQRERNREYLIVESTFHCIQGGFAQTADLDGFQFNNCLKVMCAKVQYRSPRKTPRPVMQGPQTAIVVGPSGDEIFTDKHGRVKLQFHWDRYGKSDENSSCWVRVSQVWAGGQYGAIHIPRINHEVIVEFLNGDPDQPIVTGRVYNGQNGVPYELPANATQSGIKSRSSAGGNASNFNEIRMEDKKGQEELYIHAERNHTQVTEADRSESVGHDRALSVGNNKTETVGCNRTLTVSGNKSETVEKNKEIIINGTHAESIKGDTAIQILKGNFKQLVKKGTLLVSSKKKMTLSTNDEMEIKSDSDMQIESDTKLTLKVGSSQIVMTPGKIEIMSSEVEVIGTSKLVCKSNGANEITGATVKVDGSSAVKVVAPAVDIN